MNNYLILLLLFVFPNLYSQSQFKLKDFFMNRTPSDFLSNKNILSEERSDFSLLIGSIGHTISSPLRWQSNDLIMLGGFAAATATSFLLDDEVRIVMLKNHDRVYDHLANVGFSYGAPQYAAPGAIAFYLSGLIADNKWLRTTGLMMTESLLIIGIIQIPARIIAGRARPLTGDKNTSFELLKGSGQFRSSFISGHSVIAFSFSTILSKQIDNIWASIGLYTLASLTPLSRLYDDKHWLSDTVIGTAMGVFIANTVIDYHKKMNDDENNVLLIPSINRLSLIYRF